MVMRMWLKFEETGTASIDEPDADLKFMVDGSEDIGDVYATVLNPSIGLPALTSPGGLVLYPTYRGLWLQNYKPTHVGAGVWVVDVHYGKVQPVTADTLQYRSETTGGTIHREINLAPVGAYFLNAAGDQTVIYPASEATQEEFDDNLDAAGAPTFNGLIGVTRDDIRGVDVTGPKFSFTVEKKYRTVALPPYFLNTLENMSPSVNSNPIIISWRGQMIGIDPGECLYQGGAVSDGGPDPNGSTANDRLIAVDHKFEVSRNYGIKDTDKKLKVGPFEDVAKAGWDYLWTVYRDTVSTGGYRSRKIIMVVIDRVYEREDFSQLQLY